MMESMERIVMEEKRPVDMIRSTDGLHWKLLHCISSTVVGMRPYLTVLHL